MDGWSNCNLKGFYVVTAHWFDTTSGTMKSLLLTILDVTSGTGIENQVGSALFAHLTDKVGIAFLLRLHHVVTDNDSDACTAVTRLFQLVNSHLGSKVLLLSNHIRCANHYLQRGVIFILSQVKGINEKLRGSLVSIRRSKVLRQSYRSEAQRLGYNSKEPPHQDSPTRWNSTHQMCSDALQRQEALDLTMMLHEDDIGTGPSSDLEWCKICAVMDFLRVPCQVMESVANVLEQSNATLFEALFTSSDGRGTSNQAVDGDDTPLCDEVDRYLAMGVAVSPSFVDVPQW
jgi:hypothetical protein